MTNNAQVGPTKDDEEWSEWIKNHGAQPAQETVQVKFKYGDTDEDHAMTPESDMHPGLEWLARVQPEWDYEYTHAYVVTDSNSVPQFVRFNEDQGFTHGQWLQARQDLGLVMTEEEEAMPAEERDYGAEPDMVNKPPHYQLREGYEVYDLRQDLARKAQSAGVPHDQFSDWDRALEYLLRMWEKNGVEDAKKGAWYVNKLIGKLEVR